MRALEVDALEDGRLAVSSARPILPHFPPRAVRVLVLVLLTAAASAQVNTERMRRALEGDSQALSLDASAAFASGNADYVLLGLGGRLDVQRGPHLGFVVGQADLSRTGGAAFLDRQFAHVRYNRDVTQRLVLEAFSQIERNRQQRLKSRTLLGAGLRAEVIDTDSLGLAFGATPMLEVEVLDDALEDDEARVRLSTYVAGRVVLSPTTSLATTTYVQPRADAFGDVRVLSQATISVGITRYVRLRVRANLRHDSRPPPGVEATDVSLENGLVLVVPAP